ERKVRVFKKRERIDLLNILQVFSNHYISKKAADELTAAKDREITWLREEILYLRTKIDRLQECDER
ncbi:hypothetical protein, partial [Proteiniphilum sp. UBA5280]|uniref:hypothetical protein n=1 Tax=Proteiniphilum sp. UBA5280 TaxID=1947273 RepID=UPI00257B18B9